MLKLVFFLIILLHGLCYGDSKKVEKNNIYQAKEFSFEIGENLLLNAKYMEQSGENTYKVNDIEIYYKKNDMKNSIKIKSNEAMFEQKNGILILNKVVLNYSDYVLKLKFAKINAKHGLAIENGDNVELSYKNMNIKSDFIKYTSDYIILKENVKASISF